MSDRKGAEHHRVVQITITVQTEAMIRYCD